ncbi:N-acetylmuramoyl-L-alanine amidase [Oscillospiraceae bacterium PP1C4]
MHRKKLPIILHTLLISALIIGVTFTALYASDLFSGEVIPTIYPDGVPAAAEQLRAITVRTQDNADFPSKPGMPTKELKAELDEIAAFASTYGYNAIFFEAIPENDAFYRSSILPSSAYWTGQQGKFTFFDPLKYLTNISKEHNIQVYAVIDPFGVAKDGLGGKSPALKNPDWVVNGYLNPDEPGVQKLIGKITDELTSKYDIAGIVLSGVDSDAFSTIDNYSECIEKITAYAQDAIQHKGTQRLGMVVSSSAITDENARDIFTMPIKKGDLDFVVTSAENTDNIDALTKELTAWNTLCKKSSTENKSVKFYPIHIASDESIFTHTIDNSLYFEKANGSGGTVISNYGSLHTKARTAAFSLAASFAQQETLSMPDLSYSQTFNITRPAETLTVNSQMAKYFITGTSDPSLPITYNGKEISRPASTGLWGLLVDVPYGTTTYSFSQNGVTKTATIVRSKPSDTDMINTIPKSSVYPANLEAVLSGKKLKLSCTAPAGGTVTATVGGVSIPLKQVSAVSKNGVAATYQETLDLSSVSVVGQVKNIGAVTYKLNYGGMNSSQQSAGEVYVAGKDAVPIAKMKGFIVPINKNNADDGAYSTILKKDCVDYITQNDGGAYYKLASGGYVLKSAVDIPDGSVSAKNTVSAISLIPVPKGEKLIISGTVHPAFSGSLAEGKLTVTLHNMSGFDKMNTALLESDMCSSIDTVIGEDESVALTFHLNKNTNLLGWDVQFNGNDTVIYLKRKPVLHQNTATPLSDVTVLLDPGHGGTDPGAAGVACSDGPWEKILNLANSYAIQSRLEALGATVYITQKDDSLTLNDRMEMAQKYDADLFISSHHNSLSESADCNEVSGIEVYYYNNQSKVLAEQIGGNLSQASGRRLRFANWSWYRVTMMTACPAVLVESGYICNPAEYEEIATPFSMFQYGNAVSDAVIEYFQ